MSLLLRFYPGDAASLLIGKILVQVTVVILAALFLTRTLRRSNAAWRYSIYWADILVHECAHAVCRHQLIGLLQRGAATLFWPHPLVHLLNRELTQAREEVCDNYVLRLGDARRYAQTLLELSQLFVGVPLKLTALGLFHCRWRLEDRIAGLLDRRRKKMVQVNRWTTAALVTAFLLLALSIAGTRVLQAEPAAPETPAQAAPADAKTAEKPTEQTTDEATDEKTAPPPVKKSEGQPLSLSEAEKEDIERNQRENWEIGIDLDMPSLEPQAVQYAVFDKDPVPAYVARVKRMQFFSSQQLEKADNEAGKEQLRAIQMSVDWDSGFKEVTGNNLWLLTKRPGARNSTTMSSNAPDGKKWIVTKTVSIERKAVCWCIPVEVKPGQRVDVTFNKSNTFDLRTLYDKVMREPVGIGDKEQVKKWVEVSLREKIPEITACETIEWGDVAKAADDNWAIRYKYLAKFQSNETKIMNQVFTFDPQGKFVSVKDVDGFPKNW